MYDSVHKTWKAVERAQCGHKRFYDRSAISPMALIGGQVYVKRHVPLGPNIKVSPKYEGPFRISKILPCNKYEIIGEKDLERLVVHWNHLWLTTSDPWSEPFIGPKLEYESGPDATDLSRKEVCSYQL